MPDLDPGFIQALRDRAATGPTGSSTQVWARAITRSRRRRRAVAAGAAGVLAAALIVSGVVVARRSGNHVVSTGPSPVSTSTTSPSSPSQRAATLTKTIASQPEFLLYLGGSVLVGPQNPISHIEGRVLGQPGPQAEVQALQDESLFTPALSPDRTRIAYIGQSSGAAGGDGILRVVDVNGTGDRYLASPAISPSWSPDGTTIAFIENSAVWMVKADGTDARQLNLPFAANSVAWSPDGSELAVAAGDPSRIAIVTLSTLGYRWITPAGVEQYDPAWSPNGLQIAFGQGPSESIFVANIDGSAARQVTPTCASQSCDQQGEPAWSPDGTKIAYTQETAALFQIFVVSSAGGPTQQVTFGPEQHRFPTW
jgi:WD40 repeat protein